MPQVARKIVVQILRGYKWAISPVFPPACRYVPTCSEYALEAVDRFGIFLGGAMALWRLLRCHPFAGGGYDPVRRNPLHEPKLRGEETRACHRGM